MKTIQLKLYEFAELEQQAQQKAIEAHRYVNVSHDWWDFIYDDFIQIAETLGITIKKDSIHFQGFYSQGDGSAFDAEIDLPKLLEAVNAQSWKSYAPQLELNISLPEIDRRVSRLIKTGQLEINPKINQPPRSYYVKAELNERLPYSHHGYPLIEKQLDILENGIQAIADTLNRYLYRLLQDEYEQATEDQAVTEAIEANEYWFTGDGKIANRLESLSFKNSLEMP
jgi:hypothetical protein